MKNIFLILPFIFSLIGCDNSLKGEGDANMAQDYKLEPFDAVEANGKFKLILIPNDSSYLSVQTHKNLIDNMDIYVRNNKLNIGESEKVDSFESYVVYLYYDQQLNDISINDKVYMESSNLLNFDDLEITANDESSIRQFGLNVKELELNVYDKAEVEINGSASKIKLKTKNYAKVALENVSTKVVDIDMSGESEALLNVDKKLSGRVLENATLSYIGNPQKNVTVKDNGEILND